MSLELAIQQNTAAINALIEILSKGAIPAPAAEEAQPEQPKAQPEQPKAPAKKAKKEAAPVEEAKPEPAQEQTEEPAAEEPAETAKPPTYTETAALVTKVANTKGRAVAVELLAKFGVKTLNEVKASSYAKVIEACEAVLG